VSGHRDEVTALGHTPMQNLQSTPRCRCGFAWSSTTKTGLNATAWGSGR